MFSAARARLFTQENAENPIAKKPGNETVQRKPFGDRGVNETPRQNRGLKQQMEMKKTPAPQPPKEDLTMYDAHLHSNDITDHYMDICPDFGEFQETNQKIIRSFCGFNLPPTPPPIFEEFDDIVCQVPQEKFLPNEKLHFKAFDDDLMFLEHNVQMPNLFDLDYSL